MKRQALPAATIRVEPLRSASARSTTEAAPRAGHHLQRCIVAAGLSLAAMLCLMRPALVPDSNKIRHRVAALPRLPSIAPAASGSARGSRWGLPPSPPSSLIGQGLATAEHAPGSAVAAQHADSSTSRRRRAGQPSSQKTRRLRSRRDRIPAGRSPDRAFESIDAAGDELDRAVNQLFQLRRRRRCDSGRPLQLRIEIAHHIAQGEKLASLAAKRTAWLARRRALARRPAAPHRLGRRHRACDRRRAGAAAQVARGACHALNAHTRSAGAADADALNGAEKEFVPPPWRATTSRTPALAGQGVARTRARGLRARASRLRPRDRRTFDAMQRSGAARFVDAGAALMAAAQTHLQEPARRQLLQAADPPPPRRSSAERTLHA